MQADTLRAGLLTLGFLGALLSPRSALADGAFPDSLALFAPSGGRLVLATNFGLIVSDPQATRFDWICEAITGTNASLFQVGPTGTLYVVSSDGLKVGTADGCGWQLAGGSLAGAAVADAFPDPGDPLRILAIAQQANPDHSFGPPSLFESTDGGRTFGPALFVAPANTGLTGVEVARSDPRTLYLTLLGRGTPLHPYVVRSHDGGATWETLDAQPGLGSRYLRLAAVDPLDARRLYLRVTNTSATDNPDALAISDDGGATFRLPSAPGGGPLLLKWPMTAFLRRADGSLLIGVGTSEASGTLFLSRDDGQTFSPLPGAPHVRALAERDGVLYTGTDGFTDGFALARSSDGAATWQPVLRFDQLCGPLACGGIPSACAVDWVRVQLTVGIPTNTCGGQPDAGQPSPGGKRGCRCSSAGGADLAGWGALLLALRRRRRSIRP